tara:strand:- start:15590 stop:15832 length:243 start_codon:yes stop_codon:yes gene_type:complete
MAPVGRGRVALFNSINRRQIAVAVENASSDIGAPINDIERERVNARYRQLGGTGSDPIPESMPIPLQRSQARGRVRVRLR